MERQQVTVISIHCHVPHFHLANREYMTWNRVTDHTESLTGSTRSVKCRLRMKRMKRMGVMRQGIWAKNEASLSHAHCTDWHARWWEKTIIWKYNNWALCLRLTSGVKKITCCSWMRRRGWIKLKDNWVQGSELLRPERWNGSSKWSCWSVMTPACRRKDAPEMCSCTPRLKGKLNKSRLL